MKRTKNEPERRLKQRLIGPPSNGTETVVKAGGLKKKLSKKKKS